MEGVWKAMRAPEPLKSPATPSRRYTFLSPSSVLRYAASPAALAPSDAAAPSAAAAAAAAPPGTGPAAFVDPLPRWTCSRSRTKSTGLVIHEASAPAEAALCGVDGGHKVGSESNE